MHMFPFHGRLSSLRHAKILICRQQAYSSWSTLGRGGRKPGVLAVGSMLRTIYQSLILRIEKISFSDGQPCGMPPWDDPDELTPLRRSFFRSLKVSPALNIFTSWRTEPGICVYPERSGRLPASVHVRLGDEEEICGEHQIK